MHRVERGEEEEVRKKQAELWDQEEEDLCASWQWGCPEAGGRGRMGPAILF